MSARSQQCKEDSAFGGPTCNFSISVGMDRTGV
jgi:hypothetical protein